MPAAKKNTNAIFSVTAREILDGRGYPTLEATVLLASGIKAKASVPVGYKIESGGSKDLHDGDKRRYQGKGVLLAANHINELISPRLAGLSVEEQERIDKMLIDLDGTADKSQLGANAVYAVSLAVARAAAMSCGQELYLYLSQHFNFELNSCLPTPMFNMFSGGRHADTNLDFQEFLLVPQLDSPVFAGGACEEKAEKVLRASAETYHMLGRILRESGYDVDTGAEGGYAPDMDSSLKALEMIMAAVSRSGYEMVRDFRLGIDIGSSQLYDESAKQYIFALDNSYFTVQSLYGLYGEWLEKYPLVYLEDPLSAGEWESWREATALLGDRLILAGDALFASSLDLLRRGVAEKAANAAILKPNQIGTLTEAAEYAKLARRQHYQLILSHRIGETNDDALADLAVAFGASYLKAGAPARGERVAKYNRLTEIALLISSIKQGK